MGFKKITSSHGKSLRPTVKAIIEIKGKSIKATLTVIPRTKLKYKVLLGKKTLKKLGFLIDTNK